MDLLLRYLLVVGLAIILSSSSCSICKPDDEKIENCVVLYLSANNNLSSNAYQNMTDIMSAEIPAYFKTGRSGDVLVVYSHIKNQLPALIRIYKNSKGVAVKDTLVKYPDHNSSSSEVMREVLSTVNEMFPSKNNGLILWSHGSGWLPKGYYRRPKAFATSREGLFRTAPDEKSLPEYSPLVKSFGDDSLEEMDIIDLSQALPIKYSYIIFDACLMGGIEVAYQLRNSCDYFISSPAEILSGGFPYTSLMGRLFDPAGANLKGVCEDYYNTYNSLTGWERTATISLVNTSNLDLLAQSCKAIFQRDRGEVASLQMSEVQRYFSIVTYDPDNIPSCFYDLDDFIGRISTNADEYSNFKAALDKVVEVKFNTPYYLEGGGGTQIKKFSGLSSYIANPEKIYLSNYYRTLDWNKSVLMIP